MFKELYKSAQIFENKKDFVEKIMIERDKRVLDVGFFGQWLDIFNPNWMHNLIKSKVDYVFGIDINEKVSVLDETLFHYELKNAENFNYNEDFDIIFAGDLVEHLSNPGLFLESCLKSCKRDGRIIISTPNAFNLFNIVEKLAKLEPTVNKEHTCYFNVKTFNELVSRYWLEIEKIGFIKYLGVSYKESFYKKIQNLIYEIISFFTPKFLETVVFFVKRK